MAKILIVEDNEENWDMLSRRLQRRGYATVRAPDGAQAVALAATEAPDLILMDINLPVLDGWEATRAIRGTPAGRAVPIIALTAHALSGDREKALAAGCDDYHTKPVELHRLLAQMAALLGADAGGDDGDRGRG
jgi:CheY-like chemotaxis protein